jgi:chorismate-pyruvate lyase
MRYPKNWNKLTLSEQETWLIKKYQEVVLEEQSVKRMLAQVRGKVRVQIVEEDYRPDIEALKGV